MAYTRAVGCGSLVLLVIVAKMNDGAMLIHAAHQSSNTLVDGSGD